MQIRSRAQVIGLMATYLGSVLGLALFAIIALMGQFDIRLTEHPGTMFVLSLILAIAILPPVLLCLRQQQTLSLTQKQLQTQAESDPLTGLLNRPAFAQRSAQLLSDLAPKKPCTMLLFDIDFFPQFCEVYGHTEADKVLQHYAAHLTARVREDDLFCRLDRESFAVMLMGANLSQAARLAQRMVQAIASRPYSCSTQGKTTILEFTASCGYADSTTTNSFEVLLGNATSALLQAKRQGHNRAVAYQTPVATSDAIPGATSSQNESNGLIDGETA